MSGLLLLLLLAPAFALAHEGEAVEAHAASAIFFDSVRDWLSAHGTVVFGALFVVALLLLWRWLRAQRG